MKLLPFLVLLTLINSVHMGGRVDAIVKSVWEYFWGWIRKAIASLGRIRFPWGSSKNPQKVDRQHASTKQSMNVEKEGTVAESKINRGSPQRLNKEPPHVKETEKNSQRVDKKPLHVKEPKKTPQKVDGQPTTSKQSMNVEEEGTVAESKINQGSSQIVGKEPPHVKEPEKTFEPPHIPKPTNNKPITEPEKIKNKLPISQVTLEGCAANEDDWTYYAIATFIILKESPENTFLISKYVKHHINSGMRNRLNFEDTGLKIVLNTEDIKNTLDVIVIKLSREQKKEIDESYKILPFHILWKNEDDVDFSIELKGWVLEGGNKQSCKINTYSKIVNSLEVTYDDGRQSTGFKSGTPLITQLKNGREILLGLYYTIKDGKAIFTITNKIPKVDND